MSAHLATFVDRAGPEDRPFDPANDSAVALLEFVNGAQGVIQVSAAAHLGGSGHELRTTLYGEAGTLEASYTFPDTTLLGVRHDQEQWEALAVPDVFWGDVDRSDPWNVFEHQSVADRLFIDAILNDKPVSPNFYDGWKVQQVIDAALESHQRGMWVEV